MSSSDILTDPTLQGGKVVNSQSPAAEGNDVNGRHVLQVKPISNIKDHRQNILQPLEVDRGQGRGGSRGYPPLTSDASKHPEDRFNEKLHASTCDHTATRLSLTHNTLFSEHASTSGKRSR